MSKKMIEPEKSYFVKVPSRLTDIIQKSGLSGTNEYAYKGIFIDINEVFMKNCANKPYIRRSVIEEAFRRGYRLKCKMLEKVLSNKWLFYSQPIESGADALIQPIFDMNRMNEKKISSLLRAIGKGDYSRLQKLVPNEVSRFNIYSNSLFKDEEVDTEVSLICHNSQTSAPACDGSELTPKTAQNELPTGKPTGSTPIISTRVGDIENMRVGDKENKRFSLGWMDGSGPLVRAGEPCQPTNQDKTTDKKPDECFLTAESTWDEYLGKLTLESKELQSLMDFTGDDREFLMANLDKFKQVLSNMMVLRGKNEKEELKNNYFKNEYLFTLLRKPNERAKIVDAVKKRLTFKIQTEFRHHRKGYKWDLFNKDGDRMSGGRIIPRSAPPQPSPYHRWDYDVGKWYR